MKSTTIFRRTTLPALLTLTLSLPGCGGKSGPTGPTATVPLAPSITSYTAPDVRAGNTATFTVGPTSGTATSNYVVEIGKSSGANDVAVVTRPDAATTFTVPIPSTGVLYARVFAVNSLGRSPASNEVLLGSYDPRWLIEAYFFGFGPLAVAGNLGGGPNMSTWQYGSRVSVDIAPNITGSLQQAVTDSVAQLAEMSLGALVGATRQIPDPGPFRVQPPDGVMTLRAGTQTEVETQCGCQPGACGGCASYFFRGRFRIGGYLHVLTNATPGIVAHEIGHGVGLAHIRSAAGLTTPGLTLGITENNQNPPNHLGKFDPATIKAFQAVYAAGLESGTTRSQAFAAGLLSSVGAPATLREGNGVSLDNNVDLWSLAGRPQIEIDRAAEAIYGKGARMVFDKNGDAVLTRPFCTLPEEKQ